MARKSIQLTPDKPTHEELLQRVRGAKAGPLPEGTRVSPKDLAAMLPEEQAARAAAGMTLEDEVVLPITQEDVRPLPAATGVAFGEAIRAAKVPVDTMQEAKRTAESTKVPGLSEAIKLAAESAQAPPPPPEKPSETGATIKQEFCPHCQWDMTQLEGIAAPTEADKISFVHSILGNKVWIKTVELFAGNLQVAFRTLTVPELEVCYKQAYADQLAGKIKDSMSFWEEVNRNRLVLQLLDFMPVGLTPTPLPDGYSRETNPAAETFWDVAKSDDVTNIPQIKKFILDKLLSTEGSFRAVYGACHNFNRLAAKMEAMADNSDFWLPTKAPS